MKRLKIQPYTYGYAESVITTVALWRKTPSLLPNLEELMIHCQQGPKSFSYPFDFASLFLSTSLKEVHITSESVEDIELASSVRNSGIQSFDAFLDALPTQSPYLRTISLWTGDREAKLCAVDHRNIKSARVVSSLTKLLPSLHKLNKIILCPGFIQPELLLALSALEDIRCMELQCKQHSIRNPAKVTGIQQCKYSDLGNNRRTIFCLEELILTTSFRIASQIFKAFDLPKLTILKVNTLQKEQESDLSNLLWRIRESSLLRELHIEGQGLKQLSPSCLLGSQTFLQLSTLSQIKSFSFNYPHHIQLSMSDFECLVSHWPLLEELHLITGIPEGKPYLTPRVLALLAQHCPHLRKLTINIDWDKTEDKMDEDMLLIPEINLQYKFTNLDSVDFGSSRVEEWQTAAISVLLVDLSIKALAIQLPSVAACKDTQSAYENEEGRAELHTMWKEIKKLMRIATHYRRQVNHWQNQVEMLLASASNTYSLKSCSQVQSSNLDSSSLEISQVDGEVH